MPEPAVGAAPPPSLEEVKEWVGHRIDEIGGASVARAQGVFVDVEAGAPAWLIAKLGRFGKVIAIPPLDCAGGAGHVWVAHRRETLRGAPVVDPTKALTREQELAICAHYGVPERLGRAKEIFGRPQGTVTSQPSS